MLESCSKVGVHDWLTSWPKGDPVKLKLLPMLKPDSPESARVVCVFFETPLPAGSGRYRLVLLDQPSNLLARLKNGEVDSLGFGLPRASEPVDIRLILHVPKSFPKLAFRAKKDAHPGELMVKDGPGTPFGFATYTWTGLSVPPTSRLSAEVEKLT